MACTWVNSDREQLSTTLNNQKGFFCIKDIETTVACTEHSYMPIIIFHMMLQQ